jgi:hypothetical protein
MRKMTEMMRNLDPTYETRNKVAKEIMRGCFVVGTILFLAALAMIWEII